MALEGQKWYTDGKVGDFMSKAAIKNFAMIFKERFLEANVTTYSVAVAFYMLLSLFPLVMSIGGLLPYLRIDPESLVPYMDAIIPETIRAELETLILQLLNERHAGLLSISALVTIWSAGRGIRYMQKGFNMGYGLETSGGFVIGRLISTVTIILILLLFVAFAVVFGFGALIIELIGESIPLFARFYSFIHGLRWPVTALVLFCTLTVIYWVTPNVKLRLRGVWPGAIFSTIGWLALVQTFTLYLRFSTGTLAVYGSLSAFIVLMLWLNFASIIILVGAVLNATIREYRHGKAEPHTWKLESMIVSRWRHRLQRGKDRPVNKDM